jgi:hypothetical protein
MENGTYWWTTSALDELRGYDDMDFLRQNALDLCDGVFTIVGLGFRVLLAYHLVNTYEGPRVRTPACGKEVGGGGAEREADPVGCGEKDRVVLLGQDFKNRPTPTPSRSPSPSPSPCGHSKSLSWEKGDLKIPYPTL